MKATLQFENGESRVVDVDAPKISAAQLAYLTSGDRVDSKVLDIEIVDGDEVVAYAEQRFVEYLNRYGLTVVREG
jgi:hypothetical protein